MLLIISKYNPLAGSSYVKLPKKKEKKKRLDNSRKGLMNIQNIDNNECFKSCLFKYLHLADHHPEKRTKADKAFSKELDFKNIKVTFKVRDIHKIKKNIVSLVGFQDKVKYPIYVSKKCCEDKHVIYY